MLAKRYPRTARVNELLREILADELQRLEDEDERLGLLTITHVQADPDLRHATVLFSSLPEQAAAVVEEHRTRLQAAIARQGRLKRTPQLSFAPDPAITSGQRVEEILRELGRDADHGS